MSGDWSDGYVVDIGYTHGFHHEMTPALLAFALLLKGVRPPAFDRPYAFCELGCGQGFTANLLAAANPTGRFVAIDFNPAHIAGARRLAADAGTGNITLDDASFAEFLNSDAGPFDVIALHGVYSWVSRENRRLLVDILRRKLVPGGVAYISYNALPGWAAAAPLRHLLFRQMARTDGPRSRRIDDALAFARQLRGLDAGYFARNPAAGRRLDRMADEPRGYLAHEFFNQDWTPFHFADVAAELDAARLGFAASAQIADHVAAANFTAEAQQFLGGIDDPVMRETARDFVLNQNFRRDLFVRGAEPLPAAEHAALLRGLRFALLTPPTQVPAVLRFPVGDVTLQPAVFAPLLTTLAGGPQTLDALTAAAGAPAERVLQALTILVARGHAAPVPPPPSAAAVAAAQSFNNAVMERARYDDALQAVAAPLSGGGLTVDQTELLLLLAARRGEADPAGFVWSVLGPLGRGFVRDGRPLDSEADNLAELRRRADILYGQRLPTLRALGVCP